MRPETLSSIYRTSALEALTPQVQEFVTEQKSLIMRAATTELHNHTLTPDAAFNYLTQWNAYDRLLKEFQKAVRFGVEQRTSELAPAISKDMTNG
jgi:hypothetical protein